MTEKIVKISKFIGCKRRIIGLDIGGITIKLVELTYRHGKLVLTRLKLKEINASQDGRYNQADALKDILRDVNTKNANIKVTITCPLSCMKICVIPHMPKSEIIEALKWEIKKFISFPIEQAVIDYKILQEITENGVKKFKVLLALCQRETVDKYIDILRQSGLKPSIFTLHSIAIKNVVNNLWAKGKNTVAVLDISHNFSILCIYHNKELMFNRKLPVAGQDFTRQLMQSLVSDRGRMELTLAEAEYFKRKYGIVGRDNTEVLEGKISGMQLNALIRPSLERLLTEVKRSFTYYREKEQGTPIELLILLGGGSNLKNLSGYLSENLRVPVQLGNPLESFPLSDPSLSNNEPEMVNRFASAMGAALASPRDINLLPLEIRQQTRLVIKRTLIKAAITALVIVPILVYLGMRLSLGIYNQGIATTELELTALSPQVEKVPDQAFLQNVLNHRVYWSDALKEISNLISDQVRLTEINVQKNTLILKGQIKSPASDREKILTGFMRSLEKGIFEKVNLVSTMNSSQNDLSIFELKLGVE
ncbi:MAG: type IV pilus assembly protein PilM [Sedimentisphaerales bacterium]|nr:type IV pilus assembly protein PilM [Sedimentisphaerales bacterium]